MKYKILAVDDNPINTKLLARTLVNSEYDILTAGSGKEALELAQKELPDLILLDVMMEDMDGYEVCAHLQNQPETEHIPVIFLSAKNESVDKAKGLAVGAVDYLTKPFDPVEINARVRTHLAIRKSEIRLQRENKSLKEQSQMLGDKLPLLMQNVHQTDFTIESVAFSFASQVKSFKYPQTTALIPLFYNESGLLFLLFNGFKKDYPTLMVQLMLEQFTTGFAQGYKSAVFSSDIIQKLVLEILNRFSPDIFQVAFSFALGWLDSPSQTLQYFALKQDLPCLISDKGEIKIPELLMLPYDGPYNQLITAGSVHILKNEVLCFYRKGTRSELSELYGKMFSASIVKQNFNIKSALEEIITDLPDEEDDQLISLFSFH